MRVLFIHKRKGKTSLTKLTPVCLQKKMSGFNRNPAPLKSPELI